MLNWNQAFTINQRISPSEFDTEDAIEKARFSSRSEAGRYAANIRWQGHISENIRLRFRAVKPKTKLNTHLVDSINTETQQILDKGYGGGDDPAAAWKEVVMEQIVSSLEITNPRDGHWLQLLEQLKEFSPLETHGDTPIKKLVSGIINGWAITSNDANPLSLAVQDIAQEMFGLTEADEWTLDQHLLYFQDQKTVLDRKNAILNNPDMRTLIEDVLKAQYQLTQKYFAEKGITEIEVFRGIEMTGQTSEILRHVNTALGDVPAEDVDIVFETLLGGTYRAKASTRPLSAWAVTGGIAEEFAGRNGVLMRTTIPVKDIFSTPQTGFGCWQETEIVTLGTGPRDVDYAFPSYRSRPDSPINRNFDFTDEDQVRELAGEIWIERGRRRKRMEERGWSWEV